MSGFLCVSIDKAIKQTLYHINKAERCKEELKSLKELVTSMEAITKEIQHDRLLISWKREEEAAVEDWVKRLNGWLYELDSLLQKTSRMAQQCAVSARQGARDQMSERIMDLIRDIVQHLKLMSSKVNIDRARTEGIVADARQITPGWPTVTASSGGQGVRDILAPSTSSKTISQAAVAPSATARMKLIDETLIVGQDKALAYLENLVISNAEAKLIGVHGKSGSGKTLLLKTLFNSEKVRKQFSNNGFLIWLTVSKSPSITSLRNKLWTQIAIQNNAGMVKNINEQHVEIWIAAQNNVDQIQNVNEQVITWVKVALQQSSRFVLFLDDVWNGAGQNVLEELNILQPVTEHPNSKVIVSSRDEETLSKMEIADNYRVEMKDLNEHFSWKLFAQHAFQSNDRNPPAKEEGKLVCHMCQGLPLAIKVVGRAMAGSTNPKQWRWALQRLSNTRSIYDCRLKFSFEALGNEGIKMQCCFLLAAAAYLEDEIIFARHVIMLWAGEGLLSGRLAQEGGYDPFDKGWIYLNVLADRCLIEPVMRDHDGRVVCFRIHDELRYLAIQIAKEEEKFYCPVVEKSGVLNAKECAGFTRIFLSNKGLGSLEESLRAPQLCSLLISENSNLNKIPRKVIESMTSLKFLDLSYTKVQSLPESLGSLKQLVCLRLLQMPIKILPASLTSLVNLEILDLSFSEITELPSQLHMLRSLRYLGLSHCKDLQYLPHSISQLTSLQYLYLIECDRLWNSAERCSFKRVAGISDLVSLTQVKWLELQNNGATFDEKFDEKIARKMLQVQTLRLTLTQKESLPSIMLEMPNLRRLALKCPDLANLGFDLTLKKKFDDFQNLSYLILFECGMLCRLPDLHKLKSLQRLEIISCRKLREFPEAFGEPGAFSSLEILSLIRLEKLEKLPDVKEGGAKEEGAMPKLQILTIMECPTLKTLPRGYLELKSLEKLRIYSCPVMAENYKKDKKEITKKMSIRNIRDTEEIKKCHFQLGVKHGSWVYGEFWCDELFLFLGGLHTLV